MYKQLKSYLNALLEVDGVMSVILNSPDGMVIEHVKNGFESDPDITGALAAGIFGMIKRSMLRVSEEEKKFRGDVDQVLIEISDAKIMSVSVADGILSIVSSKDVNLGMLRLVSEKVAKKVSTVMNGISE